MGGDTLEIVLVGEDKRVEWAGVQCDPGPFPTFQVSASTVFVGTFSRAELIWVGWWSRATSQEFRREGGRLDYWEGGTEGERVLPHSSETMETPEHAQVAVMRELKKWNREWAFGQRKERGTWRRRRGTMCYTDSWRAASFFTTSRFQYKSLCSRKVPSTCSFPCHKMGFAMFLK